MKPVKFLAKLSLAASVFFGAHAAIGSAVAQETSLLDEVQKRGTVVVGMRDDFPPAGFRDEKGDWVGFEIELSDALAKKLGVDIRRELVTSRTRIPLIVSGQVDVVMAAMNATVERAKVVDFTSPYFIGGARLMVRTDSPIKGVEDLAGRKIGMAQGTNDDKAILKKVPTVQIEYYQEWPQALAALVQGKIEAISTTDVTLLELKKDRTDLVILDPLVKADPWAMALRQNDTKWRVALDTAVMELWADGTIANLYKKYFGTEINYTLQVWPEFE